MNEIHHHSFYAVPKAGGNHTSCEAIASKVSASFDVSIEVMRTKSRKRNVVEPRQIAMYIMRKKKIKLVDIAAYFGFDHTTVIHSGVTVEDIMHTDSDYKLRVERLLA